MASVPAPRRFCSVSCPCGSEGSELSQQRGRWVRLEGGANSPLLKVPGLRGRNTSFNGTLASGCFCHWEHNAELGGQRGPLPGWAPRAQGGEGAGDPGASCASPRGGTTAPSPAWSGSQPLACCHWSLTLEGWAPLSMKHSTFDGKGGGCLFPWLRDRADPLWVWKGYGCLLLPCQ